MSFYLIFVIFQVQYTIQTSTSLKYIIFILHRCTIVLIFKQVFIKYLVFIFEIIKSVFSVISFDKLDFFFFFNMRLKPTF